MARETHERVVPISLRRQALEDRWRGILDAASHSGLTQSEFCRRGGISLARYFWWKRKIAPRDGMVQAKRARRSTPVFLPVRVVASDSLACDRKSGDALEVILGRGRRVVVHPGFDTETLQRLIEMLEQPPC